MSDEAGATTAVDAGASSTETANAGVAAAGFSVNPGPDNPPDTSALDAARADFERLVPEPLRGEDWFKNTMKSETPPMESLIKQWKDTSSMVGRNLKVPTETSTPEEIKNFNKALGVPETTESYTMPQIDWGEDKELGAKLESTIDENYLKGMKEVALEAGITNKQWQKIVAGNNKLALALTKADAAKNIQTRDANRADFAEKAKAQYGDRWESVMESSWQIINQSVPPELIGEIPTMDNRSRMILGAVIDNIKNKYISADNFSTKQGQANTNVLTAQDLKAQGEELMMSAEFNDPNHARHKEVFAKVQAIFRDPRILALKK